MIAAVSFIVLMPMTFAKEIVFQTQDARIQVSREGLVTSLISRRTGKEYSPSDHASPLLSLHEADQADNMLAPPVSAVSVSKDEIELRYQNGAIARVKAQSKGRYFRFQLLSLTNRGNVDDVVWGPIKTTVSKRIGDIIGVVRDDDWAIGMVGLDDNTISGTPSPGDAYGMQYYVHSADPKTAPLPAGLTEGQIFNIGGDGINDVAFYSHPEEYFQMVFGTGSRLEPAYRSSLAYHSRDRRRSRTFTFSLLPHFPGSRPRTQVTDPVDVDFVGSGVALYACPDKDGLAVIEVIAKSEKLPHVLSDGKWIRDPSSYRTDMAWSGPHDKLVEYANALGLHAVQDEGQGEYYANPADHWLGPRVGFADGRKLTYKEYTRELSKYGIKYGLHTLCLFAQAGRNSDVTPAANPMLQTVLRTRLAGGISATDTVITVTDASFLSEDGTWPMRDGSNSLRIGTEILKYSGISDRPPYTLTGIQRGQYGTVAQAHETGIEVAKLQMNCYGGFVPDMDGVLDYADYYAKVMVENGMDYIDYDGLESTLYQNHGYFGVRRFLRRFVETFGKLTNGKAPRIMGSCVFPGGWEYMSVCNIGGGNNMFDPILNRWGNEGKDVRNAFSNSYFPPTFGIQDYHRDWSVYDAENLQAKAIGWDATYMLGLSQDAVEPSGEKNEIFTAFRLWEDARAANVFSPEEKIKLRDLNYKFHLQRLGNGKLTLTSVKELRLTSGELENPFAEQPLQFSLRIIDPADGLIIGIPGGGRIECAHKIEAGQFVIVKEGRSYLADKFRKEIFALTSGGMSKLPKGKSNLTVSFPNGAKSGYELTVWLQGKSMTLPGIHQSQ
ncbi:hypothetical protein BH11ARM1_BH11ARM1_02230 [soil metagenome]